MSPIMETVDCVTTPLVTLPLLCPPSYTDPETHKYGNTMESNGVLRVSRSWTKN